MDLTTQDGCRTALASLTEAFIADGKEADTNRFKALVQALAALLQDYARAAEASVETDLAALADRLDEWEGERGNISKTIG